MNIGKVFGGAVMLGLATITAETVVVSGALAAGGAKTMSDGFSED